MADTPLIPCLSLEELQLQPLVTRNIAGKISTFSGSLMKMCYTIRCLQGVLQERSSLFLTFLRVGNLDTLDDATSSVSGIVAVTLRTLTVNSAFFRILESKFTRPCARFSPSGVVVVFRTYEADILQQEYCSRNMRVNNLVF